jgi:predicted methyltransferase
MKPVVLGTFSLCASFAFTSPACVAAQTAATMPPRATMLLDWQRQKKNVLAYIDVMPDSAITFAPTPGVRNFAQQIEHFVGTNTEVAAMVLKNLKTPPSLGDTATFLHRKPALREHVVKSYDYLIDALSTATPAQLTKTYAIYNQPAAPAWRWLDLSKEHAVWTFGQLIPYLRLNKVTPPAYDMPF